MIGLLQRVTTASVEVAQKTIAQIDSGLFSPDWRWLISTGTTPDSHMLYSCL
jgi:hypothetical protein